MLAGERAAEAHDEVRRLVEERAEALDALARFEVEVDPRVHAAVAEMAVQVAGVAVSVEQLAKLAQVRAELVGRDGRVLPAFPRDRLVRYVRGRAEARLAHRPQHLLLARIVEQLHRRRIRGFRKRRHARARVCVRFVAVRAAELDHQPAVAIRQQLHVLGVQPDRLHVGDQPVVDAFEADRMVSEDVGHVIGRAEHVGIAEHEQRAPRRAVDEAHRRTEDRDARAFGSDERTRDIEAVLGQQLVEVVAGHAPRNLRVTLADLVGVTVDQRCQPRVDLAAPATLADDALQFVVAGAPDRHAHAVVGQHVERDHVVDRLAAHDGVHAARIVADHAAERVVRMRRRVRRERQVMRLGGVAQVVEHDARLDARELALGIELDDAVQVLGEVDDDRDVAALAGEARAAAARQHRHVTARARGDRRDDIVDALRHDDADRHLPVVRRVGRIQGAAAVVEAHLARDRAAKLVGERAGGTGRARVDQRNGDRRHRLARPDSARRRHA